jgi:antitoxin CptB
MVADATDPVSGTKSPEVSRLRWRCRRGMRELDRILASFLEREYGRLDTDEQRRFAEILEFPDPDLHAFLLGKAKPSDPALARLFESIRASAPH